MLVQFVLTMEQSLKIAHLLQSKLPSSSPAPVHPNRSKKTQSRAQGLLGLKRKFDKGHVCLGVQTRLVGISPNGVRYGQRSMRVGSPLMLPNCHRVLVISWLPHHCTEPTITLPVLYGDEAARRSQAPYGNLGASAGIRLACSFGHISRHLGKFWFQRLPKDHKHPMHRCMYVLGKEAVPK